MTELADPGRDGWDVQFDEISQKPSASGIQLMESASDPVGASAVIRASARGRRASLERREEHKRR
jgi:hypothetical protein